MAHAPKISVLLIAAVNEDIKKPHLPCFVSMLVQVDKEEYVRGYQFDFAEEELKAKGYGEPFVLFAEEECPPFLMEAFKRGSIAGATPAAWRKAVAEREKVFTEQIG